MNFIQWESVLKKDISNLEYYLRNKRCKNYITFNEHSLKTKTYKKDGYKWAIIYHDNHYYFIKTYKAYSRGWSGESYDELYIRKTSKSILSLIGILIKANFITELSAIFPLTIKGLTKPLLSESHWENNDYIFGEFLTDNGLEIGILEKAKISK